MPKPAVTGRAATAGGLQGLAPAWYGKLPSLGDFASRRMPADFLHAWDAWLAAGLADWSLRDADGWLDAYLAAPSWRFLMAADPAAGGAPQALVPGCPVTAGVLMPSVDNVGRYFPFTLARALPRLPADATETEALLAWLHRADDLAVDALHDNWTVERLEAELVLLAAAAPAWFADRAAPVRPQGSRADRLRLPADGTAAAGARAPGVAIGPGLRECSPCDDVPALFGAVTGPAATPASPAAPVWWLCGDPLGALHLRISHGLPRGADFAALLGRPIGGGRDAAADSPHPIHHPGELP